MKLTQWRIKCHLNYFPNFVDSLSITYYSLLIHIKERSMKNKDWKGLILRGVKFFQILFWKKVCCEMLQDCTTCIHTIKLSMGKWLRNSSFVKSESTRPQIHWWRVSRSLCHLLQSTKILIHSIWDIKSVLHYTISMHNTNCPIVRSVALYRRVIRENEWHVETKEKWWVGV